MRREGQSLTAKYEYVPLTQQSMHPMSTKSNAMVERFGMQISRNHIVGGAASVNAATRGLTEPAEYGSNVIDRPGKAQTLQQEFETLKRKIKEVENKNQRILEKIHNTQEMERKRSLDRKPVSVEMAYEPPPELQPRGNQFISSYQRRGKNLSKESRERRSAINASKEHNDRKEARQQMVEFRSMVKDLQSKNLYVSSLLEQERVQKETVTSQLELEKEKLKKQQFRLETVKSSFRNYAECCRQIFQGQMDRLMDSVLNKLLQMDKKNKRNVEKLDSVVKKLQRHREQLRISNRRNESVFPDVSSMMMQREDDKFKSKDLDNLVIKYEQLIKTKNQQCEGLITRIKLKEKEFTDQKILFDRIKDQRRRYQIQSEEKMADLECTVNALTNQNKTLRSELSKMFMKKTPAEQSKISMKSITSDMRDEFDRKDDMIMELTSKVNTYEKTIVDKNRVVIALEKDVLLSKGKITQLFNEYQQSLEKNRTIYKQKTDELNEVINSLKDQIKEKNDALGTLQRRQKLLEQKLVQLQVDYSNMKDKLELKIQVANALPKPNVSMDCSNETDLLAENGQPSTPVNKASSQSYKHLLIKLQQLGKQNRDMQVVLIHEKAEAQMAKTYKMQAQQLQIQGRDMELRIQQLHDQINEMARHMREPSEIVSISSTIKSSRIRREHSLKDIPAPSDLNAQIEAENIRINAENIALRKELDLCERIKQQHNTRIKEFKAYIDQLEKTNEDLQNIISAKVREMDGIRSVTDQKIKMIEDDSRTLEADLRGQLEVKTLALKRLQDTLNQPSRKSVDTDRSNEIEKMNAQLEDLRADYRKKQTADNKVLDDHRIEIATLKQRLENADVELLKTQQVVRAQALKIQQLELQIEAGQQELLSQTGTQALQYRKVLKSQSQAQKIKELESALLQSQMAKAGLQRHLKTAEDNISRLMNETSDMFAELETKKNQLAKLIGIYEEKLKQQELIIANYEKQKKQPFECRKSDIKSHNSALKSLNEHQDDNTEDIDNVQLIFDKMDYSKFRRRKDQTKLLERTGQYIKKLKEIITDKNKKIKVLEKRIQSLRNTPKFHRSISYNQNPAVEEVEESDNSIKDNYSVKMQRKRNGSVRRMKQLEDETKLVVQQNNLLLQQVENLQDELSRAEQQENGLVRMKEIYKEEITKLRNICEDKQSQIANLRCLLQTNGIRCTV